MVNGLGAPKHDTFSSAARGRQARHVLAPCVSLGTTQVGVAKHWHGTAASRPEYQRNGPSTSCRISLQWQSCIIVETLLVTLYREAKRWVPLASVVV